MKFIYNARTKDGKLETGTIEASSREVAVGLLQKYNIFITSLEEQKTKEIFSKKIKIKRKVSKKDLAIFFRQLAIMLESRVSIIGSLSSLAQQTSQENFKETILGVSKLIEEGKPLSEALATYPEIFDNFYINLIKSGEESGKIASTLYYISDHLEREHEIIVQLRQAMIYPIFVMGTLFLVIGIIVVGVVPKISDLIKEVTTEPPFFTVLMLTFYEFLADYWWIFLIVFFFLVVFMVYYFNTKEGKTTFGKLSLKIPFIKDIFKKVFIARFCGNIATLMSAGISINRALKITEDTVNNVIYKAIIFEVEKKVSEGKKISAILEKYPDYFPPFVVQMFKVGEETGKLSQTLLEVVNFYQKETKRAIDSFSKILEPIMIIILGIVVGILAISVLSPLYGTLGSI